MAIARIAIRNESLRYGDRGKYTAACYDNVWRSAYRIELRGVCPAACRAGRASDRTVDQCAHCEDVADISSQSRECSLLGNLPQYS